MFSLRRVSFAPKEMRQKQNQFHFAEQRFYDFIKDLYFSFSLLCAVKEKEKIPKEKEISAVI